MADFVHELDIKALTVVTLNQNYFIVVVFEILFDFNEVQPSLALY